MAVLAKVVSLQDGGWHWFGSGRRLALKRLHWQHADLSIGRCFTAAPRLDSAELRDARNAPIRRPDPDSCHPVP
jgi:hypothetical protein